MKYLNFLAEFLNLTNSLIMAVCGRAQKGSLGESDREFTPREQRSNFEENREHMKIFCSEDHAKLFQENKGTEGLPQ